MSSGSIAAVTSALQALLEEELGSQSVTLLPPDVAIADGGGKLNLFLFQVLPNPAWRNSDIPRQSAPGESSRYLPPLALNLGYMLTAYSQNQSSDLEAQLVITKAMARLHRQPLLDAVSLKNFGGDGDGEDGPELKIERIRLTLHPLQLDDVFKLWSGFQTHYRLSVVYEASVLLIDAGPPERRSLPVLSRGRDDRGVDAVTTFGPTLDQILLPSWQYAGRPDPIRQSVIYLEQELILVGQGLTGKSLFIRFEPILDVLSPRDFTDPKDPTGLKALTIDLRPTVDPQGLRVRLALNDPTTNNPYKWRAGVYRVSVVIFEDLPEIEAGNEPLRIESNALPIGIAPRIRNIAFDAGDSNHERAVLIQCTPPIAVEVLRDNAPERIQNVQLILGSQTIPLDRESSDPESGDLVFLLPRSLNGEFVARLKVDGVASLPIDTEAKPPKAEFDPKQKITIPSSQ